MGNYIIKQLNDKCFYLLCMSCYSILSYLDELECDETIKLHKGTLIIDQLLVSGNGENRFLKCKFAYGTIDISCAKNIVVEECYKAITTNMLKEHFEEIKYSILTDNQKEMIKAGQII